MKRTQKRPIVSGVIEPDEALSFGLITGFFAVFLWLYVLIYLHPFAIHYFLLYLVFIPFGQSIVLYKMSLLVEYLEHCLL